MIDKRFTMCNQQNDLNGWTLSIVDWETDQPFDYTQYEVHSSSITDTRDEMEDLCLLLNQMNDENEQLKHRLAISEKANFVTALEKENERLKQENRLLKGRMMEYEEQLKGDV